MSLPRLGPVALALALALGSLASAEPGGDAAPSPQIGIASWYGADFQLRRTSNGEVYDKERLSCAHRTLPFGSYVLVVNLDNGSSVVVRVNDRGPFAKDRIIDLSEAAARIIGMIPTGTARVSLTLIPKEEALAWKGGPIPGAADAAGPGPGEPAVASGAAQDAPVPAKVRIQVASYSSEANARATILRLAASGLEAGIESSGGHYRVVLPDLSTEEASLATTRLESLGYRGLVVTRITPTAR
jgi:rare lipoprotein A